MDAGIEKINSILESFLGINDSELATQIWECAIDKSNSMDFAEAIDNSDLEAFGFSDDLIIELWGAVTDARDGRLTQEKCQLGYVIVEKMREKLVISHRYKDFCIERC